MSWNLYCYAPLIGHLQLMNVYDRWRQLFTKWQTDIWFTGGWVRACSQLIDLFYHLQMAYIENVNIHKLLEKTESTWNWKMCNILFQVGDLVKVFTPRILDLLSILLSVPNEETIKCVNKVLKVSSLTPLMVNSIT